jgi:glycosyltransferase involved in cell wall biosynthesis
MKSESKIDVTVFIATTAEKKRANSIRNAIKSVLSQVGTKLIIIINGNKFDASLKFELENQPDVECYYLSLGNFPEALKYARKIVDTNYFSFLDDDDELTEGSIEKRLNAFKDPKGIDAVVGNGYRKNKSNVKSLMLDTLKVEKFNKNPLLSLFERRGNWLASCSGLYRTSSIPQEYFDDYAKYAEWSYLAVKIASYRHVKLVDSPCFIINETQGSLSHTLEYYIEQYHYLFKLLGMNLPKDINTIIRIKKIDMEHQLSTLYLDKGEVLKAWYYHILSLTSLRGFKRYVLSTRYLFWSVTAK